MTIHNSCSRKKISGFTLVELAIVLAVTGVLFIGLYRLLSGGNAQLKDSSVASQQVQLINAVKGFLGSSSGQTYMGAVGGGANFPLLLPSGAGNAPDGINNANCHAYMDVLDATRNLRAFCDALPAGFSTATLNAYGQTYNIQVQTGTVAGGSPAGTPPSTYSFMILTSGGDIIPDADGGRISSQIGSDGGFLYATAGACGAQACGSYGGWQASVTGGPPGFGFAGGLNIAGHVASRTYVSPEAFSTIPWLARILMPTDIAASPMYNTMTVPLFLGGNQFYLGSNSGLATGGGTINLQQGGVSDTASNGNAINIHQPTVPVGNYLSTTSNALEILGTGCTQVQGGLPGLINPGNDPQGHSLCQSALLINGDANVLGQLQANYLFAGTFIYQTGGGASDIRLKTDIKPLPPSLDDVMRMTPVSYTFKSGGEKSFGFIAQDMEKIYPHLVIQGSDGMKAIKYDALIAPVVSAVQQLKQENDELRRQLQEQAKRQDRLEQALKQKTN